MRKNELIGMDIFSENSSTLAQVDGEAGGKNKEIWRVIETFVAKQ